MNIIVKESTMVRPAEYTPRKTLWLSRLDMISRIPYSHTRMLFIYHKNNQIEQNTPFFNVEILKESLSKALVAFYPMAGRLNMNENNNRYEIDCNAEGALFVEAEMNTHTLADLGDELKSNDELKKLMVPSCDYSKGISSFPLLMVQVTRFKCGGVCLGLGQHHHVGDGPSHVHFNISWASLARGLEPMVMPNHDRAGYLSPREPPMTKFQHLEYQPPLPALPPKDFSAKTCSAIERSFKLTKEQIDVLKQEAMSSLDYKLTTFEVLAGHVWRSACKARGLTGDQQVKLYIPIDGRARLKDPVLPLGYSGNVILTAQCNAIAQDITHNALCYAASKVRETIKNMNDGEYLRSSIDYLESQPDLGPFIRGKHTVTCPNLSVTSWARLPVDEMDFGWGKLTHLHHGGIKWEGLSFFVPGSNGDGSLSLAIKLFTSHMALFEKYFYSFEVLENE